MPADTIPSAADYKVLEKIVRLIDPDPTAWADLGVDDARQMASYIAAHVGDFAALQRELNKTKLELHAWKTRGYREAFRDGDHRDSLLYKLADACMDLRCKHCGEPVGVEFEYAHRNKP